MRTAIDTLTYTVVQRTLSNPHPPITTEMSLIHPPITTETSLIPPPPPYNPPTSPIHPSSEEQIMMHVLSENLINLPTPLIHRTTDIPNCGRLERVRCTCVHGVFPPPSRNKVRASNVHVQWNLQIKDTKYSTLSMCIQWSF